MIASLIIILLTLFSTWQSEVATQILAIAVLIYPLNVLLGTTKIVHTLNYESNGAVWFGQNATINCAIGWIASAQLWFNGYIEIASIVAFSQLVTFSSVMLCFAFGPNEKIMKMWKEFEKK